MFSAILAQVKYDSEQDEAGYTAIYLRRQAIMHVINNIDILLTDIKRDIRYLYGLVDAELGPYSVQGYLRYMTKHQKWGTQL